MKTPAEIGATLQERLEAGVRAYETQHGHDAGHHLTRRVTTATADFHLHLRVKVADSRKPRFVGAATPGFDGVRIAHADRCPVCRHQTDGVSTTTLTYEQIGAAL